MTQGIQPHFNVLELGPGTGAITKHIAHRLANLSQLTLIEIDPELASVCQHQFTGARIISEDAAAWLEADTTTYDIILSGIPFAVMNPERRQHVFELIAQRLNPDGRFIMFQYSTTTRNELRRIFENVSTTFTPFNLPPAFVFQTNQYKKMAHSTAVRPSP